MATANIQALLGLNNQKPPEKMDMKERAQGYVALQCFLSDCMNIELDSEGVARLIEGYAEIASGAYDDLYSDGKTVLYRKDSGLIQYLSNGSTITHVADLGSEEHLSYVSVEGKIYYSNGTVTGIIENNRRKNWGVMTPRAISNVDSLSYGHLDSGTYLLALTCMDSHGRESGASSIISVQADGGITIYIPDDVESGNSQ